MTVPACHLHAAGITLRPPRGKARADELDQDQEWCELVDDAEEMRRMGARDVVGLQILPEAKVAALRDRPDVIGEHHVCDLTEPDEDLDRSAP